MYGFARLLSAWLVPFRFQKRNNPFRCKGTTLILIMQDKYSFFLRKICICRKKSVSLQPISRLYKIVVGDILHVRYDKESTLIGGISINYNLNADDRNAVKTIK